MYKEWQFLLCTSKMHGTFIPIIAPAADHSAYVNCKGYCSIIMEAVVDCKYFFRVFVVGWLGSVHKVKVRYLREGKQKFAF